MEQKEFTEEVWSIKKIFAAMLIALFLIGGVYVLYKNNKMTKNQMVSGNQKQEEDKKKEPASFSLPSSSVLESGIREKINSLRKQVNDLNAVEIASSSPQVQKILKDIKDLEQYPRDQAKEACQKLCSNL